MDTLSTLEGIIDRLDTFDAVPLPERCSVKRNKNSSCSLCVDICPTDAVTLEKHTPTIDADRCTRCGACATVCPVCAFSIDNPSEEKLATRCLESLHATDGQPIIACDMILKGRQVDPVKVVRVHCLDRVDEALLIGMVAAGATQVHLCHGVCSTCPVGTCGAVFTLVTETVEELLEIWGQSRHMSLDPVLPDRAFEIEPVGKGGDGYSRRGFFSEIKSFAKDAAAEVALGALDEGAGKKIEQKAPLLKVDEKGMLPRFGADRQVRLLESLEKLGAPVSRQVDSRFWGRLVIDDEKCTACKMCAVFCPTDAISVLEGEGEREGIEYKSSLCAQCHMCEDVCYWKALVLDSRASTDDLHEGLIRRFYLENKAKEQFLRGIKR